MDQLSIFALLGQYDTPVIPKSEYRDGTVGWFVEILRYVRSYNNDDEPYVEIICRARRLKFRGRSGYRWWETIDNSDYSMGGSSEWTDELFASRPTDADMLQVATKKLAKDPRAAGVKITVSALPKRKRNRTTKEVDPE